MSGPPAGGAVVVADREAMHAFGARLATFLRAGDRRYATIAAIVLTMLVASLAVAGGIH